MDLASASGALAGWDWFGHGGALHGYISRTCVLPAPELTLSVMTNVRRMAGPDLGRRHDPYPARYRDAWALTRRTRDWSGRWWSTWGPLDLVAMSDVVLAASPHFINPFMDATEIEVTGRDKGRIAGRRLLQPWRACAPHARQARRCDRIVVVGGETATRDDVWRRKWSVDTVAKRPGAD